MDRIQFVEGFKGERKKNVKNLDIATEVLDKNVPDREVSRFIKKAFIEMLELYKLKEKSFTLETLKPIYETALGSKSDAVSIISEVYDYDYVVYDSNAQAKRNARGFFLECVLHQLFKHYSPDAFMSQVKINHDGKQKRIDFVVGTSSIYDTDKRLLYITVKKSIRERGSQVSDEKIFLGDQLVFFFYADIKKLSDGDLGKFYNEDIVVVTYDDTIQRFYSQNKNVISFEKFFLELLPNFLTDRESFNIVNFDIETYSNKRTNPGFTIVRRES
jgi:hypothetical protein